jgi:acetolactate synthase small subunit
MSTFCGGTGSVPAFTPEELRDPFPNGVVDGETPELQNGLATEAWLKNKVSQLESQGRLPKPTRPQETQRAPFGAPESKDPLKEFVDKDNEFQTALKKEYCHYESRYFSALDGFLQSVADASLKGQSQSTVQVRLDLARSLNQKLTVLTQLVNAIGKYRYQSSSTFQNQINTLNVSLKDRQTELMAQAEILQRETAAADLHKRQVEFTIEKNKANQNLLALYGVLNIVALGMIFYIART